MAKYKTIAKIIDGPSKGVSFESGEFESCNDSREDIARVYAEFVKVYNKQFHADDAGDELRALENMGWLEETCYKDGVALEPGSNEIYI